MEDKLYIGKIVGTHGIKGEVKIKSVSSFDEKRFKKGNKIYIKNGNTLLPMTVCSYRVHKQMALVSFKDHQDINLVEQYRDYEVYGDYDPDLLEEGEYFQADLMGVKVYDQDDHLVGEITGIMEGINYDILEIKTPAKQALVPYIDEFILDEDIEHQYMQIKVIKGLLDDED